MAVDGNIKDNSKASPGKISITLNSLICRPLESPPIAFLALGSGKGYLDDEDGMVTGVARGIGLATTRTFLGRG
ncbi:MAG: hypothetical protein COB93_08425 [Sneathiella sp.]|nr:MAG: hypothetical protein COB93_08425 [Sneathiella sp.]